MSLASEYQRQFAWRDWNTILAALPELQGQSVLDLGCGVGDLAAEFVARGARVIGVDLNPDLLRFAQDRRLPNAEFRLGDLHALPDLGILADGIWCSFTAAYFPDLASCLAGWARHLKPGGWIALTEIDDLFGHAPLPVRARVLLRGYEEDALTAGRYDFRMGGKLREHLERAGFTVAEHFTVADREFSFQGPAEPEVLDAWRARFQRMRLLREFCGAEIEAVEQGLLCCLASVEHRSAARVYCCVAQMPHPSSCRPSA